MPTKVKEDALSTTVLPPAPDFLPKSDRGAEQIGLKDMVLPRLKLCQSGTPERKKSEENYLQGLDEGMFFNSMTRVIYGEKIQVVPLFIYQSRIYFRDMKEGGGIICQAPDGVRCQLNAGGPCLHSNWGAKGEPPECSEIYNYPCLIYAGPGEASQELIFVSLKSTGVAAAKDWNSKIRLRRRDMFAGVYELSSFPDTAKGQSFFNWAVQNGNPPWVDPVLFTFAEKQYKLVVTGLKSGEVKPEDLNEDDAAFANRDSEV